MKKASMVLALVALSVIMLSSAQAGPARKRLHNQRARINGGVKSGELTRSEAHGIRTDERDIARERAGFMANDGPIDAPEHAKLNQDLNQDLNQQGREIRRKKHNRCKRG